MCPVVADIKTAASFVVDVVVVTHHLCHSDLLQQISREVAQLASSADLQVTSFLISFLHHNLEHRVTAERHIVS